MKDAWPVGCPSPARCLDGDYHNQLTPLQNLVFKNDDTGRLLRILIAVIAWMRQHADFTDDAIAKLQVL
ncbi:unnamed protein product, partial [Phaeothamnion confervicola]